ncbi:MAG: hypothetical protein NTW64_01975 [Candidatus Omnitrophica bacterium]|nr:hypothetical protein [Candidatus Omnitrophota bacterium]
MKSIKVKLTNKDYKIRRAQSTVEYAMMIACLVAALVGMQMYVKRSLQGRFKNAADEIGDQYSAIASRSSLTQTISQNVSITGEPEWFTDTATGKTYEITRVNRTESSQANISGGSYEETGKLSDESFY